MTAGREASVPWEELNRVVTRLLARCTQSGDCLLMVGSSQPQLRARLAHGTFTILSAMRAVYAWKHGRPAPESADVQRSCEKYGCVAPDHLVERPRGTHLPEARERTLRASRASGAERRIWSDRDVKRLRTLVSWGATITSAAHRIGMTVGTAHLLYRTAGGPRIHSSPPRGTRTEPACTRCGRTGHWRNRGCPEAEVRP